MMLVSFFIIAGVLMPILMNEDKIESWKCILVGFGFFLMATVYILWKTL